MDNLVPESHLGDFPRRLEMQKDLAKCSDKYTKDYW